MHSFLKYFLSITILIFSFVVLPFGCGNHIIGRDSDSGQNPDANNQKEQSTPDTKTDKRTPVPDRKTPAPDRRTPPPDRRTPPPDRRTPPPDRKNPNCCKENARKTCYTGPAGTQTKGVCHAGTQVCRNCKWSKCAGQVVPSAEICDASDNNCNGKTDETYKGKGLGCPVPGKKGNCRSGRIQCIGGRRTCAGSSPKFEACNGLDDDCDGSIDEVFPGKGAVCKVSGKQGPCSKGRINCVKGKKRCLGGSGSGTTEICNGVDDNCNGRVDESDPRLKKACKDPVKNGPCALGVYTACVGGKLLCKTTAKPTVEICDRKDNDCDGRVDEEIFIKCYTGPSGLRGKGACVEGRKTCKAGRMTACLGSGLPKKEVCDSLDNDCDGIVDEGVCVAAGRGPVFRFNSLALAASNVGFDLNGDGKPDNSLGSLGSFLNNSLQQGVKNGTVNILIELANLSNKTAQSGTATVYLYMGRKSGNGYKIERSSLDSKKRPLFRFNGRIANGFLKAGPGKAVLILPLFGTTLTKLQLDSSYIQFAIAKNLRSVTKGLLGGAVPSKNLDLISAASVPVLGGPGKSFLDVLVQLSKQPDIDLDRDGLEKLKGGATGVTLCTDGNGITKISGGKCAQDKRIADGYSAAFSFSGLRVKIIP